MPSLATPAQVYDSSVVVVVFTVELWELVGVTAYAKYSIRSAPFIPIGWSLIGNKKLIILTTSLCVNYVPSYNYYCTALMNG